MQRTACGYDEGYGTKPNQTTRYESIWIEPKRYESIEWNDARKETKQNVTIRFDRTACHVVPFHFNFMAFGFCSKTLGDTRHFPRIQSLALLVTNDDYVPFFSIKKIFFHIVYYYSEYNTFRPIQYYLTNCHNLSSVAVSGGKTTHFPSILIVFGSHNCHNPYSSGQTGQMFILVVWKPSHLMSFNIASVPRVSFKDESVQYHTPYGCLGEDLNWKQYTILDV